MSARILDCSPPRRDTDRYHVARASVNPLAIAPRREYPPRMAQRPTHLPSRADLLTELRADLLRGPIDRAEWAAAHGLAAPTLRAYLRDLRRAGLAIASDATSAQAVGAVAFFSPQVRDTARLSKKVRGPTKKG